MNNILHVISSPRQDDSYSIALGNRIIEHLKEPGGTVTQRNLALDPPPFLTKTQIDALYTAPDQRTPAQRASLEYSDKVIKELCDADVIVIGTPMHNMGISSLLKAWIDQIVRPGLTFGYDENNKRVGLLTGKKVYLALAFGRVHPQNPYVEDYLRAALGTVGITDVTTRSHQGTATATIERQKTR